MKQLTREIVFHRVRMIIILSCIILLNVMLDAPVIPGIFFVSGSLGLIVAIITDTAELLEIGG